MRTRSPTAALLVALMLPAVPRAGSPAPVAPLDFDAPAPPAASPPPPSDRVRIPLGRERSLGSPKAPVVMIEFGDYQCPYCRRFQYQVLPEVKRLYVDTGKVRYVVRDLPLDIHSQALAAAEAAACAGLQGKYWPMREALFAQRTFSAETYKAVAAQVGLDGAAFEACRAGHRTAPAVKADVAGAIRAGIDRTPAFVIGRLERGVLVGTRFFGGSSVSGMQRRLDDALRGP